ncbi:NADH-quinone oxidoreductase subunit N [Longispora albida]|uniref:NADH-quinone oxidoreductase subunit N n=1 Tax=Longispora albida TaxID=203523 RepID=UPI00037BBAE9|nr:NADH-quinone oxidoreductase subunit N [Longispora albida]
MTQTIDHVALLPLYLAAGTALLVFIADLVVPNRTVSLVAGAAGSVATAAGALLIENRSSFCSAQGCSYVFDQRAQVFAVLFAALTAVVYLLSARVEAEPGEYAFLLACSMAGGVTLGAARDLITLLVALETLTLPLYALVALRRGRKSAEGAVTFFVVSVIATAVTLLGAALLYATSGTVFLSGLNQPVTGQLLPLATVGGGLFLVGLAFKVAAVPLHGWAPPTYDGAPLPVALYLSTASKLGGVVALFYVAPLLRGSAPLLAILAVVTMTVGNLGALRQSKMVRLLAWSSIAQAGYVLAALVVSGPAALAYMIFFVLMEAVAFGAVLAARGSAADGGSLDAYRGLGRRSPWIAGALTLALAGLAGLPPGFAGLFAKITVVKALLGGQYSWLAVVVALNAVVALAYYARVGASLFAVAPGEPKHRVAWPVATGLALATIATVVLGFAPQLVLDAAGL